MGLDSVEGEAHVQVNDREVAVIDSPYLQNQIDVTDALRPGELNLLVIKKEKIKPRRIRVAKTE